MKKKKQKQKQKKHTPLQDSVRRYIREISVAMFLQIQTEEEAEERAKRPQRQRAKRNGCFRTSNPDRYVCMYITAFASISRTAFEIEALSLAVNRFRKKTKEHSEHK